MRRTLLSVLLGAVMLLLAGCAFAPMAASMAANLGAQTMIGKSAAEHKAERCYKLALDMKAKKLNADEMARERTKVNC